MNRAPPYVNPRGAADILRPSRRMGVGQGDFCATNCPVDGFGRINHRCGPPTPANVQVFTNIVSMRDSNPSDTLVYTVPVDLFCPEFFLLPDLTSVALIVDDITTSAGDSMLLGTNSVMGEFFSSRDKRGNRIEGCCLRAGLSIFVDLRLRDPSVEVAINVQGSFWGAIK